MKFLSVDPFKISFGSFAKTQFASPKYFYTLIT